MAAQAPLRKNPHSKNGFGGAGRAAVAGLVYAAAGSPGLCSGAARFDVWFCHFPSRMGRVFRK